MAISRIRTTKTIIDMSVDFSCNANMYIQHIGGMTA